MEGMMKSAVNCVYRLLIVQATDPAEYDRQIAFGARFTKTWGDPDERWHFPTPVVLVQAFRTPRRHSRVLLVDKRP